MTTIELANGKTINVKEVTIEDFETIRGYISNFFESADFPFNYFHGNVSKTNYGMSMYTTVDAFEEFFVESITIRVSDHSVGQRRASSEICFSYNSSKEDVFEVLGLKFNQYKK